MTKKNVLAMIMVVLIVFMAGCATAGVANATEQTDDVIAFVTIPEQNENIANTAETTPAPTAEAITVDGLTQNILEEADVQALAEALTAEAESDNEEMMDTYVENSVLGIKLATEKFFEGMNDEEILAGFIQYEGGEDFEKMLVAEIVMDILNNEATPHETLASLLTDTRYFGVSVDHWNKICTKIDDENLMIALTVLDKAKRDKDMTDYDGYTYAHMFDMHENKAFNWENFEFYFTTEHYVFYQR